MSESVRQLVAMAISARRVLSGMVFLIAVLLVSAQPSLAATRSAVMVAGEGEQAPGLPAGITIDAITVSPQITASGYVTFAARIAGAGVTNQSNQAVWSGLPASPQLLARTGDVAPGAGGAVFNTLAVRGVTDDGQVAIWASLSGTGVDASNDFGVWFGYPGALQLVARDGEPVPGLTNTDLIDTVVPLVAPDGRMTLVLRFVDASGDLNGAVLVGYPGNFEMVARSGDTLPGMPAGTAIPLGSLSVGGGQVNGNGVVVIGARYRGAESGQGIWIGTPGNLSLAVRSTETGSVVPGVPGAYFSQTHGGWLNDSGEFAFGASIREGADVRQGIWTGQPGSFVLHLLDGQSFASLASGQTVDFAAGSLRPYVSETGQISIGLHGAGQGSTLIGPGITDKNRRAILSGRPGNVAFVARQGDPAPETVNGERLGKFGYNSYTVNGLDQVLFRLSLTNASGSELGQSAIYLWDAGTSVMLVRSGDELVTASGQSYQISSIIQLSAERAVSDDGQAAFLAQVPASGERGIFVVGLPNEAPTADAGPDQAIRAADIVTLDGTGSFDDNTASGSLIYQWTAISYPGPIPPALNDPTIATPSFIATLPGQYEFALVVTDEAGLDSSPDTVLVSSANLAPTADAGEPAVVLIGALTTLDGSGSFDPENDPLTYAWSIVSAPPGSTASLDDPSAVMPSFTPDVIGLYTIALVVSDPIGPSVPDTVQITVMTPGDLASYYIQLAAAAIGDLNGGQLTNGGHQTSLINFLSQAIVFIQSGNTAQAIKKVEDTIVRTDGCPLRGGVPDSGPNPKRDYVLDCVEQNQIYAWLMAALDALGQI